MLPQIRRRLHPAPIRQLPHQLIQSAQCRLRVRKDLQQKRLRPLAHRRLLVARARGGLSPARHPAPQAIPTRHRRLLARQRPPRTPHLPPLAPLAPPKLAARARGESRVGTCLARRPPPPARSTPHQQLPAPQGCHPQRPVRRLPPQARRVSPLRLPAPPAHHRLAAERARAKNVLLPARDGIFQAPHLSRLAPPPLHRSLPARAPRRRPPRARQCPR